MKSLSRKAVWPVEQASPPVDTTMGLVNWTELGVTVATDNAIAFCGGPWVQSIGKMLAYMLPTMKNLPLSTATTLGSPDHFWLGLVLGNPTKSVKDFPAFRENPTPVSEACGSVLGEMKKAEASFQASITRFPEAAMAVSL